MVDSEKTEKKEIKDAKEKEPKESKEVKEQKEIKEIKDIKDKDTKETKEPKETSTIQKPKEKKSRDRPAQEILLHVKPAKLLVLLLQDKQWNTASLARDSGQSYVYATEVIKIFEKSNLITLNIIGKKRIIKLTEKGEHISKLILEIMQLPVEDTKTSQS